MKLKIFLCLIFSVTLSLLSAANFSFEDFLKKHGSQMWGLNPEQFIIVTKLPLRSMGKYDNVLRFYSKDSPHKITFAKKTLSEVIFNYKMLTMQSIAVFIFNRNDDGKISLKEFQSLNNEVKKYAAAASADKKPLSESRKFGKFRIDSTSYKGKINDFVVYMSTRENTPDYLKMLIFPAGKAPGIHEILRADTGSNPADLNLIVDKNGDHYVDIPLTDKKNSGFCVAASIDRLTKYHGLNVAAKAFAELIEQDNAKTAEADDLFKVISSNASKLKLRVHKLMHDTVFEKTNTTERFNNLYNNVAKRTKRPRINTRNYSEGKGRTRKINISSLICNYEYPVFKAAKCRNGRMPDRLQRHVQENLNKGIPLIWLTYEFGTSAKGKKIGKFSMQMHIINGFNEEKQSIIYIDSKGKGNGQKKISAEDAWARTFMLIAATPR